jgi:hypothetical protein
MTNDYISSIEAQNLQLQNKLNQCYDEISDLKSGLFYVVRMHCRVNDKYVGIDLIHHLFIRPLDACKHLKQNWRKYKQLFQEQYGLYKFEFKYFYIESYNDARMYKNHKKILPVKQYSWSFETVKEIEITIKTLSKKYK